MGSNKSNPSRYDEFVKIVFTKHALRKFKIHETAGWRFSKKDIKESIKNPYFSEADVERGIKIVLRKWDAEHDLRVIYKKKDDMITVITFYPAEKDRYVK